MPDSSFMAMECDVELCMHCGACVGTCPHLAIILRELLVEFNDKCVECMRCALVCPVGAISKKEG